MKNIPKIIQQIDDSPIIKIEFSEAHVNANCLIQTASGAGYVIRRHLGWLGNKPSHEKIVKIFERERFVNELLLINAQLPAPRILLIDASGRLISEPYCVIERMTGTIAERLLVWTQPTLQMDILNIAGETLRRMHDIDMEDSGLIEGEGITSSQHNEFTKLDIFLDSLWRDLEELGQMGLLNSKTIKSLNSLYLEHEEVLRSEYQRACLIHCDYNLRNILFDFDIETSRPMLTGILDTETACSGARIHDFMSLELWSFLRRKWLTSVVSADMMRNWFFEGYGYRPNLMPYNLIFLRNRLRPELLKVGYLDDRFVIELNSKNYSQLFLENLIGEDFRPI